MTRKGSSARLKSMAEAGRPCKTPDKKRRIIGGIVIFSLGYIVGANDDHRGKKHHKKDKNFKGDR